MLCWRKMNFFIRAPSSSLSVCTRWGFWRDNYPDLKLWYEIARFFYFWYILYRSNSNSQTWKFPINCTKLNRFFLLVIIFMRFFIHFVRFYIISWPKLLQKLKIFHYTKLYVFCTFLYHFCPNTMCKMNVMLQMRLW